MLLIREAPEIKPIYQIFCARARIDKDRKTPLRATCRSVCPPALNKKKVNGKIFIALEHTM